MDYFIVYKPYLVLSQFSPELGKQVLKDIFQLPKDVYPVGRLDYDSEGLLLLTNDKKLNHLLLNPALGHEKEYFVQVDGRLTTNAISELQKGVTITVNGKPYLTKPCVAKLLEVAPDLPPRNPPVRFRKNIPTSWLSITLTEGKNRQVRKMTAKVGFPTLRLVRYRIQDFTLNNMQPGDIIKFSQKTIYKKLRILKYCFVLFFPLVVNSFQTC
ncbi:MAG: pseudouridine synthase [Chitinophagaceae bacterium]|jgi:23S rRNA pseudouridine2457 synthase|nr:pseudouridine synthase [Chitinophagaceae bacterium]